jgi:phenylalanyl-tRNA synthetase beta chain
MKISPQWLRDFVDLQVNYHQLADDLTLAGIAVESINGEGEGTVFDMDITTNRPDAMNHFGVARECSAIYNLPLKPIAPQLPTGKGSAEFQIKIDEPELCPRFTGRVLREAAIKPSSAEVSKRLALLDQRPINNAVDATNYTLWEMGKPTHVFDLDLLEGGKLIVRRARNGETLKTLDSVDRKLTTEDLVVADGRKPVALAGVMGGFDTMITDKTRNILIESAWWEPITVRKMSRRHGLHTDASHRFERGADFESTVLSCDRVAELILRSGGGQLIGAPIDVVAKSMDLAPVALHIAEVHRILGEKLETHEIFRILDKLGFDVLPERGGDADFTVRIPSWRLDIEREIDLIEEIARLHGYDKFSNTLPAYAGAVIEPPEAEKDYKLRTSALALGYNEGISPTFISHQEAEHFSVMPVIELANPLSEEASVMRTSMVPGMLNMLAYNLNRGSDTVRLFEAGNVFQASGTTAEQLKRICLGATGSAEPSGVRLHQETRHEEARPLSFFDVKGDVENLLHPFQFKTLHFAAETADYYHPGRSARAVMNGVPVAQFGQIHPDIAAARKLRQDIFIAELYLDQLYRHDLRQVQYQPLPRYPAVERDFSFAFADSIGFEKVSRTVTALGLGQLRSFIPVEVFRGGAIPAGKYSLLLRARFQSGERTLREDEVAQWSQQIVRALEALGGTLRS